MGCLVTAVVLAILFSRTSPTTGFRTWVCENQKCFKVETDDFKTSRSLGECKITCLPYAGLWPKPTGSFHLVNHTSNVDTSMIRFYNTELPKNVDSLLKKAQDNFLSQVRREEPEVDLSNINVLYGVNIGVEIYDPSVQYLGTNTDEGYKVTLTPPRGNSKEIRVDIAANTFFGVRHALETVSQLVIFDDLHRVIKMIDEGHIEDKPVFPHRGIVLDSARSYISVDNIMKLLKAMSVNKLNTFHWHITDSQSFPYVSVAYPELSKDGAYSDKQVYTQEDIKKIVKHAQSLGIRVLPEFDAPAHVGEGWSALGSDLVTCFKWQPWREYCVEPPCGQLDPTNKKVYEVLGTIYKEYVDLFHSDLFHLGGDEVNINCWRSTPRITEWMDRHNYSKANSGYYKLWGEYQEKVLQQLKKTKTDPHPQAVLWTSTLTNSDLIDTYLDPEDYVIQVWTTKFDPTIKTLIDRKFRIIFSNYDELYFDCGGPTWVGQPGQNWCSPYIGWQYVYRHSPYGILQGQNINVTEETKKLVLGSEAAIWTEQIDENSLHIRLWPRAAALAERLWSDPEGDWSDAQFRMNHHRERMAKYFPSELLQPRWCYQNDGFCD